MPDANLLATQLGAAGLTKLQRLNAFIQKHPSHLDARRERLALTRPRLPNSVLEPLVAEDAARTWTAITRGNDDPWRPEPALWQREAKNLLPELEAAVERWPRNASLWRTWLGWNALKADPKSVYQYASSIETWGDRHIWAGHLPHELHTAVGEELRKAKRFQDMREWFQMGWEGMRPHLIDFGFPDRAVAFKVILTNLQEALKNLEADDALSALEKQRTAVEKSLSKNK